MPELSLNDWLAYGTLAGLFLIFIISYFIARAKQRKIKPQPKKTLAWMPSCTAVQNAVRVCWLAQAKVPARR